MSDDLTMMRIQHPFRAALAPPGSKSLANRALVLAALARGTSELSNLPAGDDVKAMIEALQTLGVSLDVNRESKTVRIVGCDGKVPVGRDVSLACRNSGTTIRFLAALCALGDGTYELDGVERMRKRPIGQLVDLLRNLGVRVDYLGEDGFPPLRITAAGHAFAGGMARFGVAQSSQFLSAVLMIAPYAKHEVNIDLDPKQTSWPYAAMTMQLMDQFGVTPELIRDPKSGEPQRVIVDRLPYRATNYAIEPDATSASYFLALAAMHPGASITIEGLGKSSLQGDVAFADVLHRMGADLVFGRDFITIVGTTSLRGIRANLAAMPDVAQTLAVVALFADGETTMRGLHTLRVKETDRLAALSNELTKLGATVTIDEDETMAIIPPKDLAAKIVAPVAIETYDDHRMAMSFALAGTRVDGITIRNASCVNKTYPTFFNDLANATKTRSHEEPASEPSP